MTPQILTRKKYVCFDLDGTLSDPAVGITTCIRYALDQLGVRSPDEAQLREWIGPPLQASFQDWLGSSAQADRAVQLYRDRFARVGLYENQLYEGVPELLAQVATTAEALFVVTSKPQPFALRIVQHFGLADFFQGVYGSQLDGTHADKGDLLAHVLHTEGLRSEQGVMVGDRRHDVLGAQKNAMPAIGVLWGFGSARELQTAGATALCTTVPELAALLSGL